MTDFISEKQPYLMIPFSRSLHGAMVVGAGRRKSPPNPTAHLRQSLYWSFPVSRKWETVSWFVWALFFFFSLAYVLQFLILCFYGISGSLHLFVSCVLSLTPFLLVSSYSILVLFLSYCLKKRPSPAQQPFGTIFQKNSLLGGIRDWLHSFYNKQNRTVSQASSFLGVSAFELSVFRVVVLRLLAWSA